MLQLLLLNYIMPYVLFQSSCSLFIKMHHFQGMYPCLHSNEMTTQQGYIISMPKWERMEDQEHNWKQLREQHIYIMKGLK